MELTEKKKGDKRITKNKTGKTDTVCKRKGLQAPATTMRPS